MLVDNNAQECEACGRAFYLRRLYRYIKNTASILDKLLAHSPKAGVLTVKKSSR